MLWRQACTSQMLGFYVCTSTGIPCEIFCFLLYFDLFRWRRLVARHPVSRCTHVSLSTETLAHIQISEKKAKFYSTLNPLYPKQQTCKFSDSHPCTYRYFFPMDDFRRLYTT